MWEISLSFGETLEVSSVMLRCTRYARARSGCLAAAAAALTSATAAAAAHASATRDPNADAHSDARTHNRPRDHQHAVHDFIADAVEKVAPALVHISAPNHAARFTSHSSPSLGSGFIVHESGRIITNLHVIKNAIEYGKVQVTCRDGSSLDAVIDHVDHTSDLAILSIRPLPEKPLPVAPLGCSESVRPGEFVVALGAPLGLADSATLGIVSATNRRRADIFGHHALSNVSSARFIQTDASIHAGNSGGPLVSSRGEVIGVNSIRASNLPGIAFAIPIDYVKRIVDSLIETGRVARPYLGIKFIELDGPTSQELKGQSKVIRALTYSYHGGEKPLGSIAVPEEGLFVMHVDEDSPALRAGLRVGDTVVSIRTTDREAPIATSLDLVNIATANIGRKVVLNVVRGDAAHLTPIEMVVGTDMTL